MQVILAGLLFLVAQADRPVPRPFFEKDGVAFWGDLKPKKAAAVAATTENLWAEPIQGADGKVTVYVPPKAVLAFLESPTRETAKAYLAWQSERMNRLKTAIELLREVRGEAAVKEAEAPAPKKPPASAPVSILYFKRADCGFCDREDAELAALAKSAPLPVETVPEGDPRWAEFGVTATPSFLVTRSDGRRTLIRGFLPAAQFQKLIEEVTHDRR